MTYRLTKEQREAESQENRKKWMHDLIKAGTPVGLLCYHEDMPIAWCSIAPEETYNEHNLSKKDLKDVWVLQCLHVASQ